MKLLLKLSIAVVLLAGGLFGFSYFLPGQAQIKQTVLINASPEQVFPYLNNPADWKRWSAWNKTYDPSLIYMYGGPVSGEGARQSWSGDKTGNWHMVFTKSTAPDSLAYELKQEGQSAKTTGSFVLEKSGAGTRVTWQQHTPLEDNPVALYKGAWEQFRSERAIQEGLSNLQALVSDTKHTTAKK